MNRRAAIPLNRSSRQSQVPPPLLAPPFLYQLLQFHLFPQVCTTPSLDLDNLRIVQFK